jgi:hypothetical protein
MGIELERDVVSYKPGDIIYGVIKFSMDQEIDASRLEIGIAGYERVMFQKKKNDSVQRINVEKSDCITPECSFTIKEFDEPAPAGEFCFPFSLMVPDWLPPSV